MPFTEQNVRSAIRHLRKNDPVMRRLIAEVGPFTLRPQRDRFRMLVRSILAQQISTSAARSIAKQMPGALLCATTSPAATILEAATF